MGPRDVRRDLGTAAAHPFGVDMVPAKYSALEVSPRSASHLREQVGGGRFPLRQRVLQRPRDEPRVERAGLGVHSHQDSPNRQRPGTAELLCPKDYSFNGKRVPTGFRYYHAFNLPHVHLIDIKTTPISEITQSGVRVGDTEYELDVLIFATGFDAMTGTLTNIDIVGRNGLVLRDKWARGIRTNLGISVNGFPNFLLSLGPQTPYSNLPVPIQLGAQWMARAIDYFERNGIPAIEATPESEEWWAQEVDRAGRATVMYSEGQKAKAWFFGENVPGKAREFQVYMGGGHVYQRFCREAEADEYRSFRVADQGKAPGS